MLQSLDRLRDTTHKSGCHARLESRGLFVTAFKASEKTAGAKKTYRGRSRLGNRSVVFGSWIAESYNGDAGIPRSSGRLRSISGGNPFFEEAARLFTRNS